MPGLGQTAPRELHSGRGHTHHDPGVVVVLPSKILLLDVVSLWSSPRTISTGQLHALLHFHFRPINPVVYWGPYPVNPVRVLILKPASRLDAFSGYPYRT